MLFPTRPVIFPSLHHSITPALRFCILFSPLPPFAHVKNFPVISAALVLPLMLPPVRFFFFAGFCKILQVFACAKGRLCTNLHKFASHVPMQKTSRCSANSHHFAPIFFLGPDNSNVGRPCATKQQGEVRVESCHNPD
jgi:hypothetical protein